MFTIIRDTNQIAQSQSDFEDRVQEMASRSGQITVGYQGGGEEVTAHLVSSLKFWVAFADSGNRYWNALGIGNPFKDGSTIIAEINPPKSGINRRIAGAFVKDPAGQVYLAHRGRVGGGRKGIGKKAFLSWYQDTIHLVRDGDRRSEMIVIGAMNDEKLIENLAAFTYMVVAFKNQAVAGTLSQRFTTTATPQKSAQIKQPALTSIHRTHAERAEDLKRFYSILNRLSQEIGGSLKLAECSGYMEWPERGVYFFLEEGETRADSGNGLRVVRVGTHALIVGAQTGLWTRLSQHRGVTKTGGGNHRGSIFRQIIGVALSAKNRYHFPSWGDGNTASAEIRAGELQLEREVSDVIGSMPFIWIPIEDEAGPDSERGYIERNSISLLSNYNKKHLDSPSGKWLGLFCDRERVRKSGLWNSNHVDEPYDPAFLDRFEQLVTAIEPVA